MKKIKLQKLTLSNWRGQNRVADFNKEVTTIKGKNEQGKTSIMSAWFWLLSGYTDNVLPKNSNLFDDTKELSKDTPAAIVEAQVEIDGMVWMLKKKAIATFKRDKANDTWVKATSDTYIYSIDNIEMSATNYNDWIEEHICPLDMLPYCLYGSFFSALSFDDKKQARKVLEKISGEIKREDFKGDYSLLDDMFAKGYSIEQILESFKKQLKEIDRRLTTLPKLIDDKQNFVDELAKQDFAKIEKEIEECKNEIAEVDALIANVNDKEKAILDARNEILSEIGSKREVVRKCRDAYLDAQNAATSEIRRKIMEVDNYNTGVKLENERIKNDYAELPKILKREQEYLKSLIKDRDDLRKKRDEGKNSFFNEEVCSACGQLLPEEQQEKLREKFNKDKALRLSIIVEQGTIVSKKIETQQKKVDEFQEKIDAGFKLKAFQDVEALKKELEEVKSKQGLYEDTEEYKTFIADIEVLEKHLPSFTTDNSELLSKRKRLMSMLDELNQRYGAKILMENAKLEIVKMKEERTELGIKAAALEGKIEKCKEYIEESAKIVSDRVNDKLSLCEIQIWERQKNGELIPSCTIQGKNGVKLSTINHANRLLIEAELQKLFCLAHEIQMPLFYDEVSVFDSEHKPKYVDFQMILLQASDDPYLVVE